MVRETVDWKPKSDNATRFSTQDLITELTTPKVTVRDLFLSS